MITTYHRPKTLEEALALLARAGVNTAPLGGGTHLARAARQDAGDLEVVDLQALGLNTFRLEGQLLEVGAAVTLQALLEWPGWPAGLAGTLAQVLKREAPENTRTCATLGGAIAAGDGRSPLLTALLALDPRLVWAGESGDPQPLGDYLALRRTQPRRLLLAVRIPLNAQLHYEQAARSPLDLPIVCAAGALWPSGRARLTLGGYGAAPILAMDGQTAGASAAAAAATAAAAAASAYLTAADEWASADYRAQTAAVLAARVLQA